MSPRALARLFGIYAVALVALAIALYFHTSLRELPESERTVVESWWSHGKRVGRVVWTDPNGTRAKAPPGVIVVNETVTATGPLSRGPWRFELGLVPGLEGVKAELDGKIAYATVDDLVAYQAYDRSTSVIDPSLGIGTHRAVVMHLLAEQLGATAREVEDRASFERVRFAKRPRPEISADAIRREDVLAAVRDAAHHLARGVDDDGRFRYLVDGPSNATLRQYNWPRHAGTTYFLAQAAALLDDAEVRFACLRAASLLRDVMTKSCGEHRCIAEDDDADVGSNALALIAFSEIVSTGADPSYWHAATELAAFLRSLQRPDGELMHLYKRSTASPVDVQYLYYTGEAALALSRVHRITGDPRDLAAASAALARLSGSGWSFFGSRYYYSEEHWTCQAAADLWDRAPNPDALGFCLRWHEYQRRLQYGPGATAFDADGSFGVGPVISPRVTPAASRGEAAGAALAALLSNQASLPSARDDIRELDLELRHALAFVLRHQLRPWNGDDRTWPSHLFADPDAIRGAMPGSAVDWQLRIDYAQHAGSMMIRWLELERALSLVLVTRQ